MKNSLFMRAALLSLAAFSSGPLWAQSPASPLAYWDFNTATDPAVTLDKVASYPGNLMNGAVFGADAGGRTGQPGDRAMDFGTTDADQALVVDDTTFLDALNTATFNSDTITISFWVKWSVNTANSSAFWFVSPSSANASRGMHSETPWGTGNVPWDTGGTAANTQRIQATPANYIASGTANEFYVNKWHHFAFTKDGTHKAIWVDGRVILEGNQANPLVSDFTQLVLGAEPGAFNNSMRGLMDDFAVFPSSLHPEVVIALARGASPSDAAALSGDTDSDGIIDAWEVNNNFDRNSAADASQDADTDSLTNLQEFQKGTNPRDDDSDDDSLKDNVETDTGTYVSATDTGTDPLSADSDRDGLKDGVETKTGTFVDAQNTGTHPLDTDTDDDGFADNDEVVFGSSPVSATSVPGLTAGQVSYWPLNEIQGTKTPDVVRGYDLNLINMTGANVVPGKWGNAFQFNGTSTMLERGDLASEELPIYTRHRNFTVSVWVNGPTAQQDKRVFSESSSLGNQPLFNIGTHQTAASGVVDTYIRTDANTTVNDHQFSAGTAYDDTWHHLVYVQREDVPGSPVGELYIDGVKDEGADQPSPVRPMTANITSIGGVRRGSDAAPTRQFVFTGLIDDVAVWKRALTPAEITKLFTDGTPAAPPVLQPIQITRFQGDFPVAVTGDSVTLRWDVSSHATKVEIDQGIGDVTSRTVSGVGSISVPITGSKTYKMTITRGAEVVTAETPIRVATEVAANWAILEDFEGYDPGPFPSAWWGDLGGNSSILEVDGNKVLDARGTGRLSILSLSEHAIDVGEERTIFARLYIQGDPATAVRSRFGVTDRGLRSLGDTTNFGTDPNTGEVLGGVGPAAFISNESDGTTLLLGARDGSAGLDSALIWDPANNGLLTGEIYNVWINVVNGAATDVDTGDKFTIFIQKEGDAQRTEVFTDFISDRSRIGDAASVGGALTRPILDRLFAGNDGANSVFYDDFFISKTGLNATIPRPLETGGPDPTVSIRLLANQQIEVTFAGGVLEERATLAAGSWSAVQGATSPFTAQAMGDQKFYRVRK